MIDIDTLLDGELIEFQDTSLSSVWKFPPLYSDSANGGMLIWQIGCNENVPELIIKHGMIAKSSGESGEIQEKKHPIVLNSSKRTIKEQSFLEARRRFTNKYKSGYYRPCDDLQNLKNCKPMLANKYKPPTTGKSNITRFPVSTMPKLDGIRALMKKNGNKIIARSRVNNEFAHLEHIKNQLLDFFLYLPEGCELDGELYCKELLFNELTSAVKTVKKKHPNNEKVVYNVFDIIESKKISWPNRHDLLKTAYRKYKADHPDVDCKIEIVPQEIAMSHDKILEKHEKYLAQGYEGTIIRHCLGVNASKSDREKSLYKPDRSNNLLKFKYFHDKEVEIIGGTSCVGTEEGAVKFKVRDEKGQEFDVRPRGTMEQRREWFKNLDKLIGKMLTIKYQEESVYSIPRFAVGVAIRDYE